MNQNHFLIPVYTLNEFGFFETVMLKLVSIAVAFEIR